MAKTAGSNVTDVNVTDFFTVHFLRFLFDCFRYQQILMIFTGNNDLFIYKLLKIRK